MPNKNYVSGRRKEYCIVKEEKRKGYTAFRSAGSHSPVDVVSIDSKNKVIKLIQSKPKSMSDYQRMKLESLHSNLNGNYAVVFVVV